MVTVFGDSPYKVAMLLSCLACLPAVSFAPAHANDSSAAIEHEVHCSVEAKCIAKLPGIANRTGNVLRLKLDNGSTKSIRSTDKCELAGESCDRTTLLGYRPSQHMFVVQRLGYEIISSAVVSQLTGQVVPLEAEPHFSPDGTRFVVVALDEQNGMDKNIAIFDTSAFPPLLEWSYRAKSFSEAFMFAGWNGNDRINLLTWPDKKKADLNHTPQGWKFGAANRAGTSDAAKPPQPAPHATPNPRTVPESP